MSPVPTMYGRFLGFLGLIMADDVLDGQWVGNGRPRGRFVHLPTDRERHVLW